MEAELVCSAGPHQGEVIPLPPGSKLLLLNKAQWQKLSEKLLSYDGFRDRMEREVRRKHPLQFMIDQEMKKRW